jgi:hypothetical protein
MTLSSFFRECGYSQPNVALRQVLLDLAWRPSDSPMAGVGSRSTPLRDIEGSVH